MASGQPYHKLSEPLMSMMKRRTIVTLALTSLFIFFFLTYLNSSALGLSHSKISSQPPLAPQAKLNFSGSWDYERDRNNLGLSMAQCEQVFPGLFEEIDRVRSDRKNNHITKAELDSITPRNGYVRAMIYNQQLYMLKTEGSIYTRELATLLDIYRAILSSPEPIPNIEFAYNTDDKVDSVALWGYARREEDTKIWLIPDFGYWSWPETLVGTIDEVKMKAVEMETLEGWSWKKKTPKIIWRGATMGLKLREKLIEVTKDKPWADVKALTWRDKDSMQNDLKSMPEHCQYKYLAHTEGNTYSGRLKYLQNCRSVIIAHKLEWIQHHYPLLRSSGPDQNYVEVDRDFAELPGKIKWLSEHDKEAEQIAANNVKLFRERYLTPAAEACYWRRLMHAWAEVSFKPEFYKEENGKKVWRGLPMESYVLMRKMEWPPH